jgi:hypothetical protein
MSIKEIRQRLTQLESLVEQQEETITAQRERLAQLESLVEQQEEIIKEKRGQPSQWVAGDDGSPRVVLDGGNIKVLGEISVDNATGVLGKATGSGTTYGVKGEASEGYGLYTPDDTKVDGTAELAALGGGITRGQSVTDLLGPGLEAYDGAIRVRDPLPPSESAPSNPAAVLGAMEGSGTSEDPYVITTDQELQATSEDLSANYVLGRDIDASLTGQWNSQNGFTPVGTDGGFSGSFDGRGHAIVGLTIDRSSTNNVGLFGESEGTVENVRLVDVDTTGKTSVAGLVGVNEGTVQQVAVGGSVSAGNGLNTGGIVGTDTGTLKQSISTATVSGDINVGGVVGDNTVGTVEQSIGAGSVTGNTNLGGIVGNNDATTQDAYWDTDATGQSMAIGNDSGSSNDLTGLTTADLQGSNADSNLGLLDFTSVWTTRPSDYPTLQLFD